MRRNNDMGHLFIDKDIKAALGFLSESEKKLDTKK